MRRRIPSTAALAAFEAAARHLSFTRAAQELLVTQSAVGRQIAVLEAFVGVPLFVRSPHGLLLTDAGASYACNVRARLDEVERDTWALMARGGADGSLELGVGPTFATRWLLPRLPDFQRAHPGITLHLTPTVRPFQFEESALDGALFAGTGGWPGTRASLLLPETLIAVGVPQLLAGRASLDAADIARLPLLQLSGRPYAWRRWFESQGLQIELDLAGPRMALFSMLSEAAVHGLGVALVPRFLVQDELDRGVLAQLTPHSVPSDRAYYLIYPEHRAQHSALVRFRHWIEDAAGARGASALPSAPQVPCAL